MDASGLTDIVEAVYPVVVVTSVGNYCFAHDL